MMDLSRFVSLCYSAISLPQIESLHTYHLTDLPLRLALTLKLGTTTSNLTLGLTLVLELGTTSSDLSLGLTLVLELSSVASNLPLRL